MGKRTLLLFIIKLVIIISLGYILHAQSYMKMNRPRPDPKNFEDIEPEHWTAEDFSKPLPFENGEFDESEVEEANTFFHLPYLLTPNFVPCNESDEYSCFELVRAYRATKEYLELYKKEGPQKYVVAELPSNATLACRMSSLYNAFLIAMFTKRILVLETDDPDVGWLHSQLKPLFTSKLNIPSKGLELPSNFTFPCEDVNVPNQSIIITPCMWPQISYIHPYLAPRIRSTFGIHAAFYICNFLFNEFNAMIDCEKVAYGTVAAVPHTSKKWRIKTDAFKNRMVQCIPKNKTFVIIEENEDKSEIDQICMMKKLVSSDKIVYSFGSVLGWMSMAMAMQREKGAAVDIDGSFCMDFRNSQSGSLIHTYNPKKFFHYSSNNDFLLCGPNYNDARIYERYLMW